MRELNFLGLGVMLHVLHHNVRAAKLHRQLGFIVAGDGRGHAEMRGQAAAV